MGKEIPKVVDPNDINSSTGGPKKSIWTEWRLCSSGKYSRWWHFQVLNTMKIPVMTGMKLVPTSWASAQVATSPRPHLSFHIAKRWRKCFNKWRRPCTKNYINTGASPSVKLFSATSKTFSAVASPVYASTDAAFTDIGLANVKVGDVVAITGSSAELTLKRHNGNSNPRCKRWKHIRRC